MAAAMSDTRIWTAALVVIGDEILSGRTQDANVAQLAKWLNGQGIRLAEVRVVPDDMAAIAEAGGIPGVALNPMTPLSAIEEALPFIGQALIMSVNPGFGGQTLIPTMLDKARRLRALLDQRNPSCRLQIDGGVKVGNIRRVVEAGIDTIVVGSAIYGETPVPEAVAALRRAIAGQSPS